MFLSDQRLSDVAVAPLPTVIALVAAPKFCPQSFIYLQILTNHIMKKFFVSAVLVALSFTGISAQDILGRWKTDDGTAIVEVYKAGDAYNGKIVWLEEPTMKDGSPMKDVMNPDPSLRGRELMGLNLLSGLKPNGDKYDNGTIYDPASGKTYRCSMFLEKGVLKVRGHVGPFHRTMDWIRQN